MILASDWNLYRKDGCLIYVSEDCVHEEAPFFLSLAPREANGSSGRGERRGFDNRRFHWWDIARRIDPECIGAIDLPEHEPASVRTGQLRDGEPIREGEHRFDTPRVSVPFTGAR